LCPREREQGEKAKRRLTELEQHFDSLPRKTGSNGGYGRGETRAFVGGKSVGEILVAEGLAVKSNRSSKKHNWCVPIVRI
jgi:endonuclease YncB( thermonuclease family)